MSIPITAKPSSGSFAKKLREGARKARQLVVAGEVVVLDVRNDRDRRLEQRKRSVRLVRFGDEPRRGSVVRVALQRNVDATQHEARIDSAPAQYGVRHRGGRRLTVRPADRDAAAIGEQTREHLAAMQHRNAAPHRRLELRDCRRSIAELTTTISASPTLPCVVPDRNLDALATQLFDERRNVRRPSP